MANNRIFYAVQAVGIGHSGIYDNSITSESVNFQWMKGVQSVGITTNFNLEQVFELGQLAIYENLDNVPEIEVTIEKVLDGEKLLYLQSVGLDGTGNIVAASNRATNVFLAIYPDTYTQASGTGAVGITFCSGMRISNVAYNFSVDGNSTESITLQGNDKYWLATPTGYNINSGFGSDRPNSSVARRQDIQFGATKTVVPATVSGVIRGGNGNIQSIAVSTDFGRDNIFELGSYRPYTKFTQFPIQVTCDFEVISLSGDYVTASGNNQRGVESDETIQVWTTSFDSNTGWVKINLGSQNRLSSVNYTGGDTGGGNATATYSYINFNDFLVEDYWATGTQYHKIV